MSTGHLIPTHNFHLRHHSATQSFSTTGLGRSISFMRNGDNRGRFSTAAQIFLIVCVLFPLIYLVSDRVSLPKALPTSTSNWRNRKAMISSIAQFPAAHLKNLVLVAGHAVYTGLDFSLAKQESSWFLEPYQKVAGEAQSFIDHIELGVKEASNDPEAMLLFSGGQTRQEAGPRSEGLSYWVVAEAASWFGTLGVRNRTFTEEHARDSFENLLFGLCRFYELTGHYPRHITVISYTLKQDRFSSLHREAVQFPSEHFSFIGTPIPPLAKGALEGEARTVAAFRKDPYGCNGELQQKRLRRDPFAVGPIHPSRCPDMKSLLGYCAPTLFTGVLPWVDLVET
ncbi:hypothetical protein CEUSTIGMA_g7628.t1 [Chlamydomonas eustigma]|uniref:DUF218 domain-containing protein n=1 Tax=Chlamydomonas eustigma TaxID=1157962 RepID=A0A250XBP4_9CHLO|nr:hypothetical protein CEUSTIGMA_g7628.t1 [Chlamydomonas eustigma]|eukprot:GAX80190.1 hypothetical protein CEUSTIGMA_g7628.t1 [Chlamydomonas eustigma]